MVNTVTDSGFGSLRQAILDVSSVEQDTITFAANVTNVITLTSGPLVINKSFHISGPGPRKLTISGNNASRIFHVTNNALFVVSGLTIAHGLGTSDSGGGGILADSGYLNIVNCQITSNAAASGGGILFRGSGFNMSGSSVTHNQADLGGGGIAISGSPQVSISQSTIASNRTTRVYDGFLFPSGGGVFLPGGTLQMVNSTVAGNHSTYIGGGFGNGIFTSGTVEIRNSIIADNTAVHGSPDVFGPFLSGGYNLVGDPSGSTGFTNSTDLVNVNPLLGDLGHYGGSTLTMPLLSGSPAIDKGNSFGWATDQRGVPRPWDDPAIPNASGGDGADIGAFELARGPTLFISRFGDNVIIEWFPETSAYVLEESAVGFQSSGFSEMPKSRNEPSEHPTRVKRVVGEYSRCSGQVVEEYWRRGSESDASGLDSASKMPDFAG